MMSGSNATPAATTSTVAALTGVGTNGNASGTPNRELVDKAVERARCDFEEHLYQEGSVYDDDIQKMQHHFEAVTRPQLERIAALKAELESLRARPGSAASSGNGAAAAPRANAAPTARGKGRGRGRGHSAAAMVGTRETLRLATAFQF